MKLFSASIFILSIATTFSSCTLQLKNVKTDTVRILGNCVLCETAIIHSGSIENTSQIQWNLDTKTAVLSYDSTRINQSQILKLIALAGYDNDQFLAPDDIYSKLPDCCRYVREQKSAIISNENFQELAKDRNLTSTIENSENQLESIFENYFIIKDALVNSDPILSASTAKLLHSKIKNVKLEQDSELHSVWLKVVSSLLSNIELISLSTNLEQQRNNFMNITADIYKLLKVSNQTTTIYYQHCPMYNNGNGSNWLSKEKDIKNPYFGSVMLTCGNTIETIK